MDRYYPGPKQRSGRSLFTLGMFKADALNYPGLFKLAPSRNLMNTSFFIMAHSYQHFNIQSSFERQALNAGRKNLYILNTLPEKALHYTPFVQSEGFSGNKQEDPLVVSRRTLW